MPIEYKKVKDSKGIDRDLGTIPAWAGGLIVDLHQQVKDLERQVRELTGLVSGLADSRVICGPYSKLHGSHPIHLPEDRPIRFKVGEKQVDYIEFRFSLSVSNMISVRSGTHYLVVYPVGGNGVDLKIRED